MSSTRLHVTALALAVLTVATAACGDATDATKAGGSERPVTLRLGTNDAPGREGSAQIEELARQVDALSDGAMRIEPAWEAAGQGIDDWDQRVARLVVQGELELGLIPSRAWDTEGVTSLRALNAPFLVTSEELVGRIVASEELAGEMLDGLASAGVVGLALLPEGLRHPFAFEQPLLRPDDYAGRIVRTPTSRTAAALFEALGATADDLGGDRFDQALAQGTVAGAESSFRWSSSLPRATIATGNVVFYPKVNVLVANPEALDELSDEQREILAEAAARTRTWAVATAPGDAAAAQAYCEGGGTVVTAEASDLAALEAAVAPVYAELERDPQTRTLIERFRALGRQVADPPPPAPCAPVRAAEPSPVAAPDEARFPEGVYRTVLRLDDLLQRGIDPGEARANAGIQTLTLARGRWAHESSENATNPPICTGSYTVDAGRVVLRFETTETRCGTEGHVLLSAAWTLDGDVLRFVDVESGIDRDPFAEVVWGSTPWRKIG